ncbi:MAG: PD-(D/E)XK nuclease family protein [Pseudomonadota bacterium]
MHDARCLLVPPGADFAAVTAQYLLDTHRAALPDLSALTLVVPQQALATSLREALLHAAGGVLLMPSVLTLAALAAPVTPPASALACRLRLAEAMSRFRFLFEGQTPLRVGDALYTLFDELERQAVTLPEDEAALEALLRSGYGATQPLAALSREAQIVHRLHQAFREELGDAAPAVAQVKALHQTLRDWPDTAALLFAGFDVLSAAEAAALRLALAKPLSRFITQGRLTGRDSAACLRLFAQLETTPTLVEAALPDRSRWLDAGFADGDSAHARAASLRETPLTLGNLALVAAADPEHEAQCADLAVREALLEGAAKVVVVCNDRRLARRLRARLERAHIALADRGGWALSTSRAAATLDAWLDCVEQDFPFRPLFALLKSGFMVGGIAWADALEPRAYRSEIAGGAARWREAMPSSEAAQWAQLMHAARAVQTLGDSHAASDHADGLLESLQRLGLDSTLAGDAAGSRLLARVQELREALAGTTLKMQWRAFRALLDTALEDATFPAAHSNGRVQLLTLDQTQGLRADAVIVTGTTPALFASSVSPFFNASVRRELGLPAAAAMQALALTRLRRVLEAAPRLRLLYAPEQAGEEAQAAAPLLALIAFARAAGHPLPVDAALAERAPLAEIAADSPLPAVAQHAAPAAVPLLLARPLSAGGHQTLIECPYAFHARYALGLKRLEEPDAPVDRSDYGDRVHRILHAFETQVEGMPPPYSGTRDEAHLPAMAAHLQAIAQAVFAPDLAERPLARFWRQAFATRTPWLSTKLASWPNAAVRVEADLVNQCEGWRLQGRADRIDDEATRCRVVDYKSGQSPSKADLLAGEAVQLPHYALLADAVSEVEYWNLKDEKALGLDEEELDALLPAMSTRLGVLASALERGAALPAHGTALVCDRCEFIGVCRKQDLVRA